VTRRLGNASRNFATGTRRCGALRGLMDWCAEKRLIEEEIDGHEGTGAETNNTRAVGGESRQGPINKVEPKPRPKTPLCPDHLDEHVVDGLLLVFNSLAQTFKSQARMQ
jgi:hypothetical protein